MVVEKVPEELEDTSDDTEERVKQSTDVTAETSRADSRTKKKKRHKKHKKHKKNKKEKKEKMREMSDQGEELNCADCDDDKYNHDKDARDAGVEDEDHDVEHREEVAAALERAYESGVVQLRGLGLTRFPSALWEFPGEMTQLDLAHNRLTQVPPEIATLSSLRLLDLSHNMLTQLPWGSINFMQTRYGLEVNLMGNPLPTAGALAASSDASAKTKVDVLRSSGSLEIKEDLPSLLKLPVNESGAGEHPLSRSMELSALFSEEQMRSPPPRTERVRFSVEVRVMFRFDPEGNPSLLELRSGEILYAIEPHSADWWVGRKRSGQTGLFPAPYTTMFDNPIFKQIKISRRRDDLVRVCWKHVATADDQLNLERDDVLQVLLRDGHGWSRGRLLDLEEGEKSIHDLENPKHAPLENAHEVVGWFQLDYTRSITTAQLLCLCEQHSKRVASRESSAPGVASTAGAGDTKRTAPVLRLSVPDEQSRSSPGQASHRRSISRRRSRMFEGLFRGRRADTTSPRPSGDGVNGSSKGANRHQSTGTPLGGIGGRAPLSNSLRASDHERMQRKLHKKWIKPFNTDPRRLKRLILTQAVLRGYLARKHARKCIHAEKEILDTESSFIEDLSTMLSCFSLPMLKKKLITQEECDAMFGNAEVLLNEHRIFCTKLREAYQECRSLSSVFLLESDFMIKYAHYINNYDNALRVLTTCQRKKTFRKFIQHTNKRPELHDLTLQSFLILPIQRLPRYVMLIKTLAQHEYEHRSIWLPALHKIERIAAYIDQQKGLAQNVERLDAIQQLHRGQLSLYDQSYVYDAECELIVHVKIVTDEAGKLEDLELKRKPCKIFLFSQRLVLSKPYERNSKTYYKVMERITLRDVRGVAQVNEDLLCNSNSTPALRPMGRLRAATVGRSPFPHPLSPSKTTSQSIEVSVETTADADRNTSHQSAAADPSPSPIHTRVRSSSTGSGSSRQESPSSSSSSSSSLGPLLEQMLQIRNESRVFNLKLLSKGQAQRFLSVLRQAIANAHDTTAGLATHSGGAGVDSTGSLVSAGGVKLMRNTINRTASFEEARLAVTRAETQRPKTAR